MKKEPEIVQCPKAVSGECKKSYCSHTDKHLLNRISTSCSANPSLGCPACEPVKPKNVVALLKSISHWDLIAQGLEKSKGIESCECCKQFYHATSCSDCLIAANGHYRCKDTPYEKVLMLAPTKTQTPEALDAIEAEVEFLISCLPKTEQKAFSLENVRPFLRFGDKVWFDGDEVRFIRSNSITHFDGFCPKTSSIHAYHRSRVKLSPPKPKPQLWETLEVGQPLVVKNCDGDSMLAFFQSYNKLELYPITIYWGFDLAPEDFFAEDTRLLTRAEAQKLGFDLNRWQWADDKTQKRGTK